jgi:flagellar basal-body rod modification protein FlgD
MLNTDMTTTSAASSATRTLNQSTATLSSNFTSFIKLLTTQLKNQDPTQPTDPAQFTQQLVSFNQVEETLHTNSLLQDLLTLQQSNSLTSAVPYLGHTAIVGDATMVVSGGNGNVSYTMPDGMQSATVTVHDAKGNAVYTGNVNASSGTHVFTWDGKTSKGTKAADGNYTVSLAGVQANGQVAQIPLGAQGKVVRAGMVNDTLMLTLADGSTVPATRVTQVY